MALMQLFSRRLVCHGRFSPIWGQHPVHLCGGISPGRLRAAFRLGHARFHAVSTPWRKTARPCRNALICLASPRGFEPLLPP